MAIRAAQIMINLAIGAVKIDLASRAVQYMVNSATGAVNIKIDLAPRDVQMNLAIKAI